jgi:hypothetical protein
LLTVITQRGDRKNRYQFQLTYGQGSPRYVGVTIVSDRTNSQKTPLASLILKGYLQAFERGLISSDQGNQDLEGRVRHFLNLVADNVPALDAAEEAGVSMALIEKLADLGRSSTPTTSRSSDNPFFPFPRELKPFVPIEQ